MVTVSPLRSRRDLDEFVRFPWKIYANLPRWVPPLVSAQKRELDRERGPFFTDGFGSTAEFFLARRGREVVGRIAAIRNERHLARHQDEVGFFGFFEAIDEVEVARALLEAAEGWLREQGLAVARGPTSFTINDQAGVTIEGMDVRPAVLIGYTPMYYADLLEACGYRKVRDLLSYHLRFEDLERNYFRFESAFSEVDRGGVEIRQISRKNLDEEAAVIARVFSESWDHNWGAFPMIPEDLSHAARELGPFFDERLGYVATVHGEPAGVFLAILDPWEIVQGLNGKMGPIGTYRLLTGRERVERCRVIILGSLPRFRNFPLFPLMLREIQKHRKDFPALKTIELSWILEDNRLTRDLAEAAGGKRCRTLRLYDKYLA